MTNKCTHITNDFYKLEAKKNESRLINSWKEGGQNFLMYDNGNVFVYQENYGKWVYSGTYLPKPLPHQQEDLKPLFEGGKNDKND